MNELSTTEPTFESLSIPMTLYRYLYQIFQIDRTYIAEQKIICFLL